jgi:hypothetical protein
MMITMVEKCTQPFLVLYLINGWRLVGDLNIDDEKVKKKGLFLSAVC